MKSKKLLRALISILIFLSFGSFVYAVNIPNPFPGDFVDNFVRLTSAIRPATVLLFLGVIMWGGFTIETAGDSSDKFSQGWKIILSGIIGFVVMIVAPSIPDFIGMIFGTGGLIDF